MQKLKPLGRLLGSLLFQWAASLFLGPLLSVIFFQNHLEFDFGDLQLAWLFGAVFSLWPFVISLIFGVVLLYVKLLRNKHKNIGLLLMAVFLLWVDLIYFNYTDHIARHLNCYFPGMLLCYAIPVLIANLVWKPFMSKSDVKGSNETKSHD